MIRALAVGLALLAAPASAQDTIITSPIDGTSVIVPDVTADQIQALTADGASLKGLDKMSGQVQDLDLSSGQTVAFGNLAISLGECRYPEDNPTGEAYAWLSISDTRQNTMLFEGWMIASSPALNALDHARYDVWVIRCTTA